MRRGWTRGVPRNRTMFGNDCLQAKKAIQGLIPMHHMGCMTGPEPYMVQGNIALLLWCTIRPDSAHRWTNLAKPGRLVHLRKA
jgi:hypothetical protein